MGIVKEITSAAIPYVALGVAGYLAYRFIARSDVGKTVGKWVEDTTEKVDEITSRTPQDWGNKFVENIPIVKAVKGDWAAALANTNPIGLTWNMLN